MWLSRTHLFKLVIAVVLTQAAGLIGSYFAAHSAATWYATLTTPAFSPPYWLFGPTWTIVYALVGIALFLVWTRHLGGHRRTLWLRIFMVHLVLSTLWSILFFGKYMLFGTLVDAVLLLLTVVFLFGLALRFDTRVATLVLPYLCWVSFVTYLNFSIWQLNT